jgi:hypothetical protein
MILYKNDAAGFGSDVDRNQIVGILERSFIDKMGYCPQAEIGSWLNSMRAMESIVRNSGISDDCGVLIEYKIPLTSKRVDFIVAGLDDESTKNFVIIELKQWQDAESTNKSGVVVTYFKGGITETTHPSYQAQSYKYLIQDFNQNVRDKRISLSSCAYLHNFKRRTPEPLTSEVYAEIIEDTPIYFRSDYEKLQRFLSHHVGRGKGMEILYEIQHGRIRPSKKLIDHVCSMYEGNQEFVLIDNQKVAYEKALELARSADEKTVLIVKGGPGTGKSVVSVNLLGGLLQEELNTVFVAPNAAFREVMIEKLSRDHKKTHLRNLFKGSSSFLDVEENIYDAAIVDEAHRLKGKSAYQYFGKNQIEDIVRAARTSIMFIDDDQRIRPEDIGTVSSIKKAAKTLGAKIYELELEAQFRCSGAEGYINWLDHVLHIRQTANYDGWDGGEFDFRIFDDPNELHEAIKAKSREGYDARLLAGYAWRWTSEKEGNPNGEVEDVVIEEFNFRMPWNSRRHRTTWAVDETGIDQIGCIHTSQGLEFDYVGVIVGNDLRLDPESNEYHVDWGSYKDVSGKKTLKDQPRRLSLLVRNIYKILMSRGMRGCYVFFCDKHVEKHIRSRLADPGIASQQKEIDRQPEELEPYRNCLPLIPLRAVATAAYETTEGYLPIDTNEYELIHVEGGPFNKDRFLVRAEGDSMEPKIHDGDLCMFRFDPGGSRKGKIVLCAVNTQGGSPICLIKRYRSARDVTGRAMRIVLESLSPEHEDIVVDSRDDMKIIGVFVSPIAR